MTNTLTETWETDSRQIFE